MYACNGILFNHESPRRGETFVTRKITRGLANISLGLEDCLYMGNIDALRDWGHAKDYVRMQWMMLQQDHPEDFVIATGKQYSVRQFIEWTAAELGMKIEWRGKGVDEKGYWLNRGGAQPSLITDHSSPIVAIDPRYFRPPKLLPCSATRPKPNKNSVGCQRSPRKRCAKRWSPTTWPKPSSMRCSRPMVTK